MSGTPSLESRPVRVLMYTAYFDPEYSGAALQALTLARELRRRGYQVEFVTTCWPGMREKGEVEGFAVQRIEPGRWRKHREFRLWFNLCGYVWRRRRDFDILHSHGAYYTCAIVGPLGRWAGLKSLVKASLANDDLQDLKRPLIGYLHRQMLRCVDAYVGISLDLVQEFRVGGLRPEKIHHLPNGVDTELFQPCSPDQQSAVRDKLGLPSDRPIVLYVGVLDQRKNIEWLAEQWVKHRTFGTNGLLLAVGPQSRDDPDGILRGRLAALSRSSPELFALRDFSHDIGLYYQCANALILPSLKEGLPNVVLEAMASGLPCVVARASGSRELVMEGKTGFTYAHGDVAEMSRALQCCLSAAGEGMGRKARQLAEERYSIQVITDRYVALYDQLLKNAG